MGATPLGEKKYRYSNVSTHAPVMGATPILDQGSKLSKVSTHAPVMGATVASVASTVAYLFQPTRP